MYTPQFPSIPAVAPLKLRWMKSVFSGSPTKRHAPDSSKIKQLQREKVGRELFLSFYLAIQHFQHSVYVLRKCRCPLVLSRGIFILAYIATPHAQNAERAPVSRTTLHLLSLNFNGLSIVLLLKTPTRL